jgi:hypothetical protein
MILRQKRKNTHLLAERIIKMFFKAKEKKQEKEEEKKSVILDVYSVTQSSELEVVGNDVLDSTIKKLNKKKETN